MQWNCNVIDCLSAYYLLVKTGRKICVVCTIFGNSFLFSSLPSARSRCAAEFTPYIYSMPDTERYLCFCIGIEKKLVYLQSIALWAMEL